jgi:hypothetical protein
MPFIEGQTLQEAIEGFHGDESLRRNPGQRSLSSAACSSSSSRSATPSLMPTIRGWCTATSSRRTSCSAPTARPW